MFRNFTVPWEAISLFSQLLSIFLILNVCIIFNIIFPITVLIWVIIVKKKGEIKIDPIITSALTAFVTASATKGMNAPMQTLDDLWYLVFGDVSQYANKKRALHEVNLAKLKDSIMRNTLEIHPNNLQEPPMSIVGPALEASKYYIEEEGLREMFAKVIAASMDSSQSENVHHSFVEIIKQLSPRDANNLDYLKDSPAYPIVNIISQNIIDKSFWIIKASVFTKISYNQNINEYDSSSISNLTRLGLFSMTFESNLTQANVYDSYLHSSFYKSIKNSYSNEDREIVIQEGILRLTPLGESFIKTCL